MGPGSHGGYLGSTGSISSLIPVSFIREQIHTMGLYMSDPEDVISSVICSLGLSPQKRCVLSASCHFSSGRPKS